MKLIDKIKGKRIVIYGLLLIAVALECAVDKITVFGIEPCFVYPLLLVAAFHLNEKEIAVSGLLFGVLLDFQTSFIGYNAIFFTLTLYFVAILLQSVLNKNLVTFITAAIVLTVLYFTLAAVFYLVVSAKTGFFTVLIATVLPKTAITVFIALLCYFIVKLVKEQFVKFWGKDPK